MFTKSKNLFDMRFARKADMKWRMVKNAEGIEVVELALENTGFFNTVAQKFFNRPKVSYIKLDELGSYVWLCLEKKDDLLSISKLVEEKFGEKANPLLPRLGQFIQTMLNYNMVVEK